MAGYSVFREDLYFLSAKYLGTIEKGVMKMSQYSILWFSGTGTTLLCARALAVALTHEGAETELVDISAAAYWQPPAGTTLIFCWPVYCFGPPRLVRKFIKQMLPGANQVYQLCSLGGDGGGAMSLTVRLLRSKGYEVCGGTEILMPNNFAGGRVPVDERQVVAHHQVDGLNSQKRNAQAAQFVSGLVPWAT
mgnify:CR=1 FL=1